MGTLTSPAYREAPSFGYAGTLKMVDSGDVAVATGDIDNGDLVKVFRAPRGFTVLGAMLITSDLDSGGSPSLSLALGDTGDDDRYLTGQTIGRTGGAAGGIGADMAVAGCGYTLTADTDIYIKVTAAAATAAAGTVRAILIGVESAVY